MSAKVCLVLLALVGTVAAQYVQLDYYGTKTDCSGTATLTTYLKSGQCVVGGTSSSQVTISGATVVSQVYSDTACKTAVGNSTTYGASGSCTVISTTSYKVTYPASGSFIGLTTYSDTACATATFGPSYFSSGVCMSGIEYKAGSTLTLCAGCTSSSDGTCTDTGVKPGACTAASTGAGSVKYDFSSASSVVPSLTIAVAAVAAALALFQ